MSRVAGKGAAIVEYLIQVFFKRLDALGTDNKQVGSSISFSSNYLAAIFVYIVFYDLL